jgi:hypothetical protein
MHALEANALDAKPTFSFGPFKLEAESRPAKKILEKAKKIVQRISLNSRRI